MTKKKTAKKPIKKVTKSAPKKKAKATLQKKPFKRAETKSSKKPGGKSKKKSIPIGRTIKTKDEYLPYRAKDVQELKVKRWVAVIDKNTNEELAIVRLTKEKQPNTTFLHKSKNKGKEVETRFKHFVETEDNEGNAIRVDGKKFIENLQKYDLKATEVKKVRNKVLYHSKQSTENKRKIEELKNKGKKK